MDWIVEFLIGEAVLLEALVRATSAEEARTLAIDQLRRWGMTIAKPMEVRTRLGDWNRKVLGRGLIRC